MSEAAPDPSGSGPGPGPAPAAPDPPGPRLSAALAGHHVDGGWVFGVVAKRTYLISGGRCHPHPEQLPLVEEPLATDDGRVLEHDCDLVLQRKQADIIVRGHAYPHGGRASFEATIEVGAFVRRLGIFGDRRVSRGTDGRLQFSPPEGFEKMPLGWERAYGGVDEAAREDIGDPFQELMAEAGDPTDPTWGLFSYPRNPVGRGYLTEDTPAGVEQCRLPNVELVEALLTPQSLVRRDFMLWPSGPPVASTGWLHHSYFPRSVHFGHPPRVYHDGEIRPRDFLEVWAGWINPEALLLRAPATHRLDPRAAQQAALGMRCDRIDPDATIELTNLHPTARQWRFDLPDEVPRMAFKLPEAPAANLRPAIRTLVIEPDLDRVVVVWAGETQVPLPVTPKKMDSLQHGVIWPDPS